jgi:molybdopterin converting factor subunit 1
MRVNILAFGIAKDIFGASAITVDLPETALAGDLKAVLEQQYPRLKQLASYLLAVNNEYAGDDLALDARDEIAVIPPVSGG